MLTVRTVTVVPSSPWSVLAVALGTASFLEYSTLYWTLQDTQAEHAACTISWQHMRSARTGREPAVKHHRLVPLVDPDPGLDKAFIRFKNKNIADRGRVHAHSQMHARRPSKLLPPAMQQLAS